MKKLTRKGGMAQLMRGMSQPRKAPGFRGFR